MVVADTHDRGHRRGSRKFNEIVRPCGLSGATTHRSDGLTHFDAVGRSVSPAQPPDKLVNGQRGSKAMPQTVRLRLPGASAAAT